MPVAASWTLQRPRQFDWIAVAAANGHNCVSARSVKGTGMEQTG